MKLLRQSLTSSKAGLLLAAGLVALVALVFWLEPAPRASAATIRISAEPVAASAKISDVLLININNGDGTYTTKQIVLSNLVSAIQGSNSVLVVTNSYVTIQYVTNNYVTTNFVSQSFVTNSYVSLQYVTNQYVTTNFVSQSFVTNMNVNKLTVQNFFTQNGWFTTNAFPTSTNTFDLTNSFQLLQTFTSAAVTNLASVSNNYVSQGMLIVSNASGTNITLTITIPNISAIGQQSTSSLTIAAGKMAWARFMTWGNVFTNYADDTFAGNLAALGSGVSFSSITNNGLNASQFVATDANKALASTLDGRPLIYSDTNSISQCFTWGGPSNAAPAGNGFYFFTTTTPFSFTNYPAVAGSNTWSTIVVSNQTAAAITGYVTIPGIRIYGFPSSSGSTNALIVPAGKTAVYSFLSVSTLLTNCQNAAQSN
jgi:hypothetical protein